MDSTHFTMLLTVDLDHSAHVQKIPITVSPSRAAPCKSNISQAILAAQHVPTQERSLLLARPQMLRHCLLGNKSNVLPLKKERRQSMGKITAFMSMSLDGFIAGPKDDDKPDRELETLDRLSDWMFRGKTDSEAVEFQERLFKPIGAVVMGRRILAREKKANQLGTIRSKIHALVLEPILLRLASRISNQYF
jgi:hypothetical protein